MQIYLFQCPLAEFLTFGIVSWSSGFQSIAHLDPLVCAAKAVQSRFWSVVMLQKQCSLRAVLLSPPKNSGSYLLAWLPLQSLAVKKKIMQFWAVRTFNIFFWKVPVKYFLSGLRGAKHFSVAFQIVFRIFFRVFQTVFRIDLKVSRGSFVLQTCRPEFGGSQKGGFQKGGFGGCSPGTKTGTRVRSPIPPFWKPPFYLPMTLFGVDKRVVSKRVVSADVPPERKPQRGYVCQNHPFTKPPFYLPVTFKVILMFWVYL